MPSEPPVMNMSNRVEELEATVTELESTVDGLTEELVEAKERIRELESDRKGDHGRTHGASEPSVPDPEEFEQMKRKLEQARAADGTPSEAEPEDVEAATAPLTQEKPTESDASPEQPPENGHQSDEFERDDEIIIA